MGWVTFETERGGLLKVQVRHVVALYDEQGVVKLSTTAGGVHTLARSISMQKAESGGCHLRVGRRVAIGCTRRGR